MSRRKIVVDGRVWKYRVGYQFVVAKAEDTGEGRRDTISKITDTPWNVIERACWKGNGFPILPSHIAAWLKAG